MAPIANLIIRPEIYSEQDEHHLFDYIRFRLEADGLKNPSWISSLDTYFTVVALDKSSWNSKGIEVYRSENV